MTHEGGFGARREEPDPQVVVGTIGLEHEGGIGIVEFAGDREHLGVGQCVGFEHDAGGVSSEFDSSESVDLMNLNGARHASAAPVSAGHG
jgi:hypothetical protein